MITMGISIDDVINFMTSDSVKAVTNLLQDNIFDTYNPVGNQIKTAIKILKDGVIPVGKFIYGKGKYLDENGYVSTTDNRPRLAKELKMLLEDNLSDDGTTLLERVINEGWLLPISKEKKYYTLAEIVSAIYKGRVNGIISEELLTNFKCYDTNRLNMWGALHDYMNRVISIRKRSGSREILFEDDLQQFEQLLSIADEISTLGSKLLSLNQGIPVKKEDLIKKVIQIEEAINQQFSMISRSDKNDVDIEENIRNIMTIKPWYDSEYIGRVLSEGVKTGMVFDFDFMKFINDPNYRKTAIELCGLTKQNFNILDVINRLPHYNAIFKLFRSALVIDSACIKKSEFLNYIVRDIRKKYNGYKNYDQIGALIQYIDSLFIKRFIKDRNISLKLLEGDIFINDDYDSIKINDNERSFDIDSNSKIAAFKRIFENRIIPQLQSGNLKENTEGTFTSDNKFIKALRFDTDVNGRVYVRLDADMMNIESTPYNAIKYQEILSDFIKLKSVKLDGIPLTDLFMLYSIIVSRTNFGEDRMTNLFSNFINMFGDEESLIKDYMHFLGKFDFSTSSITEHLESLEYNIDDALYAMAPLISETDEHSNTAPIVKELVNGQIVYKKRINGKYQEVASSIIIEPTSVSETDKKVQKYIRYRNMKQYGMMSNPVTEMFNNSRTNIKGEDPKLVAKALAYYMNLGYFNIRIIC